MQVEQFKPEGTRNFVRLGDRVKVLKGGADKTSFQAKVTRIDTDADGTIASVEVSPLTGKHVGRIRVIRPERIERKSQTRNGRRWDAPEPKEGE